MIFVLISKTVRLDWMEMERHQEKPHKWHLIGAFTVRGGVGRKGEIFARRGLISIYRFEIVKLTSALLFRNLPLLLTVHIIVFG